jgi:hypothetical protein
MSVLGIFRQQLEGADETAGGFSRAAFSNQKNNRDNAVPSPPPPWQIRASHLDTIAYLQDLRK